VLYWPPAITWHTHRRTLPELKRQFRGYSAGLSAFYVSMLRTEPQTLVDIVKLVPQGIMDLINTRRNGRTEDLPDDFPSWLLAATRRGILRGAPMYLIELAADRLHTRSQSNIIEALR